MNNLRPIKHPLKDHPFTLFRQIDCLKSARVSLDLASFSAGLISAKANRNFEWLGCHLKEFLLLKVSSVLFASGLLNCLTQNPQNRLADHRMVRASLDAYFNRYPGFGVCATFADVLLILDTRPWELANHLKVINDIPPTIEEFKAMPGNTWDFTRKPLFSNEDWQKLQTIKGATPSPPEKEADDPLDLALKKYAELREQMHRVIREGEQILPLNTDTGLTETATAIFTDYPVRPITTGTTIETTTPITPNLNNIAAQT